MTGSRPLGPVTDLLFDRLTPPVDPSSATDGGASLAESIARELERLVNTRTPAVAGELERRPITVMDYGIPDLSLFPAADADARATLARNLTRAIELWEPRLRSPLVVIERASGRADALLARIVGKIEPAAGVRRVSFAFALANEPAVVDAD